MKSPFPGMDPFIEVCGLWEDFHSHLIEQIADALVTRVPPHYVIRTGVRDYTVLCNNEDLEQKPSCKLILDGATSSVSEEFSEKFIEVIAFDADRQVVTCIEVLSPSNKREFNLGWLKYERQRRSHLMRKANLVEIDLLRAGQSMHKIPSLPQQPYSIVMSREGLAPYCIVLAAHYHRRLPELSIPLDLIALPVPVRQPDSDTRLDLQGMVDAIYTRYWYARDIDYSCPLDPPLPAEDVVWLGERIKARSS